MSDLLTDALPTVWHGRAIDPDFRHMVWLSNVYQCDAGYIVAAFQQAYGIDLTREKMHWFRFRALFAALPEETLMAKIMSWRTMDLSEYEGSMRAHYADLQERFALPAELRGGAARVVSVEEHDAAFLARFRH